MEIKEELDNYWNEIIKPPKFLSKDWFNLKLLSISMQCEVIWWNLHSDEYRNESWILKHKILFFIYGFSPVAMGSYGGEDTFVFETSEEAVRAFEIFERGKKIPPEGIEEDDKVPFRGLMCGWWYGEQELKKEILENNNDEWHTFIPRWKRGE